MTENNGSGWVEQFLSPGDALYRGGRVEQGQAGVRFAGDIELTDKPEGLALLGRELVERFSGQAFPDGVIDPRIVITGNPVDGFDYYGPTPLDDTADAYREARTRLLEERGDEWWLAELRPLSDLEPIDGDDRPPVQQEPDAAERARIGLRAVRRKPTAYRFDEAHLADMIADVMHLAVAQGLDPDEVLDHGRSYYQGDDKD